MERNLDRRVEALVRVTDPVALGELDHVLAIAMSGDCEAFDLGPDGLWTRQTPDDAVHLQDALLRRALDQAP
jgi:polyphosphate kinase